MNTQAFTLALSTFIKGSNDLVRELRQAAVDAGFTTWEDCRPVVLTFISNKYGCPTVVSKSPQNKGQLVLDSKHAAYVAAQRAFGRLKEALCADADAAPAAKAAKADHKTEGFDTPAEIAALAAQLVAACREYDMDAKGLKALAAQAVAEAFAKKA
jgi:hypothetical protein